MTEEFTLNEVLRYCRTVDCDVGLLRAKAILENSTRNQLLARATLSGDHDSDITSRDLTDHLKNFLHSRRATNYSAVDIFLRNAGCRFYSTCFI